MVVNCKTIFSLNLIMVVAVSSVSMTVQVPDIAEKTHNNLEKYFWDNC